MSLSPGMIAAELYALVGDDAFVLPRTARQPVAVIQAFQKLSFLRPLAPTQTEPPFIVAQVLVLAVFAGLGYAALKHFPARTLRVAL